MELDLSAICANCLQLSDVCIRCMYFSEYYEEEDNDMAKDIIYDEIGKIKVTDKTDFTLSWTWEGGKRTGVLFGGFTRTAKYTGPTKGHFIPIDKLGELKALIGKVII